MVVGWCRLVVLGDTYPRVLHQPAPKPSRLGRVFEYLRTHNLVLSGGHVQIVRDDNPRRRDTDLSWQRRVPKWIYLTGWIVMASLIGFLASKLTTAMDKESQRIEAALLDAPTKYQARLSERVAVVEEQQAQTKRSVDALTSEIKSVNATLADLNVQLKLFTAELKKER